MAEFIGAFTFEFQLLFIEKTDTLLRDKKLSMCT